MPGTGYRAPSAALHGSGTHLPHRLAGGDSPVPDTAVCPLRGVAPSLTSAAAVWGHPQRLPRVWEARSCSVDEFRGAQVPVLGPAVPHGPSPLTPSTVCGSACLGTVAALATPLWASAAISIALPLPDSASASVTRGEAKIPFCNLFLAKSFSRGSLLTLDCPCTATQMEPHQICSRLGFRGQCRPLVRPFLVASLAVTRRTTGINNDLITTQGTCWGFDLQLALKTIK